MKLSKYINQLQKILEKHGDVEKILSSIDDEGNGYNHVNFGPSLAYVRKDEIDDYVIDSVIGFPDAEELREEFLEMYAVTEQELNDDFVVCLVL